MFNKIKENISVILAALGIILGMISVSLYKISPTIHLLSIGLALILSCSVFLIINKRPDSEVICKSTAREKRILDIAFLVLFSASLLLWHYSFGRSVNYFIVFSICAGIVALSILMSDTRVDYFVQYIKIILLSFNIKYSIFMFAGFIPGIDTYVHAKMNDLLANAGNTSVLVDKEFYFPIMHVQTAIMQIITEVGIKDASNFAVIIPFIFATTFVYLVGRALFGEKVGLLSMLIVNVADFHVYWGSSPQTTTYGIILFYILMYLLYCVLYNPAKRIWITLSLFIMFTLIITHAVSSFIFIVTIFGLVVGSFIYNIQYIKEGTFLKGLSLIAIIALIQYWSFALYNRGQSIFNQLVSNLYYHVMKHAGLLNRPEAALQVVAILPPFIERFTDSLGLSLYLLCAILGVLIALTHKYRNQIVFNYFIVLLLLFGITFAFPLFGIRNILPTRWFAFEYFFVCIFAAFSIIQISYLFNKIYLKRVFVLSLIFVMTFFMISNSVSNLDSPIWLKETIISTTYTHAEIQGAKTMFSLNNRLFSDYRYGGSVLEVNLGNPLSTTSNIEDFEIFLWRNYMLERPILKYASLEGYDRNIESTVIYGLSTLNQLEQTNKIYENGELTAFKEGYITFKEIL